MDSFKGGVGHGQIDKSLSAKVGTYIQGHIQAYNITRSQKLFKFHVLRSSAQLIAQLAPVVVLHLHSQRFRLLLEIPSYSSHTHNTHHFAFWIMPQRRWGLPAEFALAQVHERGGEHSESTKHEEESGISGCCVDGCGDIGYVNARFGAVWNIALVVSRAWWGKDELA